MKKLLMLAAVAAIAAGCSVTKINYKKDADGVCEYRVYHNSHWLKTEADALHGSMTGDGKFSISGEGMKTSPSEEFNRAMQTYMSTFIQLAQIAAAAYNPSASAANISRGDAGNISRGDAETRSLGEAGSAAPDPAEGGSKNLRDSATPREENTGAGNDCPGGSCTTGECVDGSCTDSEAN